MSFLRRVFCFYRDGFRSMVLGRTLWKIIFIKLVVMFAVLKLFFFPNFLQTNFSTDQERADHVLDVISQPGSGGAGLTQKATAVFVVSPDLKNKDERR